MPGLNFTKAGYEGPGDWARLRDLFPDGELLKAWRARGWPKAWALRALRTIGVDAGPYDAEAARVRNVPVTA